MWVSGFYGSGKSHLVRVLEQLWRDLVLPGGDRARDLVTLPADVAAHLSELSNAGKRLGGLWSAAGTLAAGRSDAVRLAFLSVLFESAGLPADFSRARFTMWAAENGHLDAIRAAIEAAGRTYEKEIHDLYVSTLITGALLSSDSSLSSAKEVRDLLKMQFPPTTRDVTEDEMFDAMDDLLRLHSTKPGKLPLVLVVLDEMQQYIGDDGEKALAVQDLVEGCSRRFESQVLFVATGQSALIATPTLQKLTGRFSVPVALSDTDVETVVREVVLRKKPEHVPALKSTLDSVSGEIDKHLGGTQLAPKAADKPDLVPDYPLLPTRRRFWEMALRAIDKAGKGGQLRTQLRMVHEAAAKVAAAPVGHVVGADFLYEEQSPGMLMSGVLLKEIDELIRTLRIDGPDGVLKSRICSLIFLISQIPARAIGGETGLRASAPYLADLLVEDLADGGARLRKRVPEMLDALVADGRLMRIDDEYLLQTERRRGVAEGLQQPPRRHPRRRHPHEPTPQRAAHGRCRERARRAQVVSRNQQDASQDRPPLGPGRTAHRGRRCPRVDPGRMVGHGVGGEEGCRRSRRREPHRLRLPAQARSRPDQGHPRQLRRRRRYPPAPDAPD